MKKLADALDIDISELTGGKTLSPEEEENFLRSYREMRRIYPRETLLMISPSTYRGYNLETCKKIILKVEEIEW